MLSSRGTKALAALGMKVEGPLFKGAAHVPKLPGVKSPNYWRLGAAFEGFNALNNTHDSSFSSFNPFKGTDPHCTITSDQKPPSIAKLDYVWSNMSLAERDILSAGNVVSSKQKHTDLDFYYAPNVLVMMPWLKYFRLVSPSQNIASVSMAAHLTSHDNFTDKVDEHEATRSAQVRDLGQKTFSLLTTERPGKRLIARPERALALTTPRHEYSAPFTLAASLVKNLLFHLFQNQ